MRVKYILMRYPAMRESAVAFVRMESDVIGKVLPRLGKATGSDVVYNGKHVQILLLNDRLRGDVREFWRRIRAYSLSEDAQKLGLTLDQVIPLHMLQAVEQGHARRDTFDDTLDWWRTRAGRQTWVYTALELNAMWEGRGPNCPKYDGGDIRRSPAEYFSAWRMPSQAGKSGGFRGNCFLNPRCDIICGVRDAQSQ